MARTSAQEELNEKRACERFQYKAPCVYSIEEDSGILYDAEIYNYGLEGLCLSTKLPLKPGNEICLRMVNHCSDSAIHYHAKVRWCHKNPYTKTSFSVGLQYSRKHTKQVFGFKKTKSRKLFCRHSADKIVPYDRMF